MPERWFPCGRPDGLCYHPVKNSRSNYRASRRSKHLDRVGVRAISADLSSGDASWDASTDTRVRAMISLTRRFITLLALAACLILAGPAPAPAPTKLTLQQAGSRISRDFVPAYEDQQVIVTGQISIRPIWITDSY